MKGLDPFVISSIFHPVKSTVSEFGLYISTHSRLSSGAGENSFNSTFRYEGLVDFEDWFEVKNMPKLEPYEIPSFEYAPTRDLNETLKRLTLAN